MDNIRVISLRKKTNKRDLYKEILSSSSKVKDIIAKRKTKNKKFDYLDKVPDGNVLINLSDNTQQSTISKPEVTLSKPLPLPLSKPLSKKTPSNPPEFKKGLSPKIRENKRKTSPKKIQQDKMKTPTQCVEAPKSFNNLIPKEKTQSKTQKVKKIGQKKLDDFFNKKNNAIKGKLNRIFNKRELIQICSIIKKCNHENNYSKIHYILRKINRNQTIQLLKIYNISKNRNKAPLPLLKNILFNYLTSNIVLIY